MANHLLVVPSGFFSRGPAFSLPKDLSVQQSFVPDLKSKFLLRRSSKLRTKSSRFPLIADKFYLEPEHLAGMDPLFDFPKSNCFPKSAADFRMERLAPSFSGQGMALESVY